MPNCHEMKFGQVYFCENCGLELQVVRECHDVGKPVGDCDHEPCTMICCGRELKLKEEKVVGEF